MIGGKSFLPMRLAPKAGSLSATRGLGGTDRSIEEKAFTQKHPHGDACFVFER